MRLGMFRRHVTDDLVAYDDRLLDRRYTARVADHLSRCASCRAALADVRLGRSLLQALPAIEMPAAEAARLTNRLREPRTSPDRRWKPFAIATGIASVLASALLIRQYGPLALDLVEMREMTGLARVASDLHDRADADDLLDIETSDAARVREWQLERGAPETALASRAPSGNWPDTRLRGASVVDADGALASLVSYTVDGHPVTLVTARHADVRSAPDAAWLVKRVQVGRDARGRAALVWSTSGQTYAIVSDLPDLGHRACLVCHADPGFRRRLDRAVTSFGAH